MQLWQHTPVRVHRQQLDTTTRRQYCFWCEDQSTSGICIESVAVCDIYECY